MYGLFRHADERLSRELLQLETEVDNDDEFDDRLKTLQNYLVALGKEAFDENAEWLLLYRARTLKSVLAG